jgi:hypothetical protein
MLFRAQVRTVGITLLQAAITQAGAQFSTSKDTPVEAGLTPAIIVYTDDRKVGVGASPPQFRTRVLTTVEITVEGDTLASAEALLDTLCELTENTLLGSPAFIRLFEGIDSVETRIEYRGVDAERHTFAAVIEIEGHVTEIFEPTIEQPLNGINVYVDSINIFDKEGTYVPPFVYPVGDAPRPSGPDGRPEGGFTVDFGPVLADENDNVIEDGAGHDILGK